MIKSNKSYRIILLGMLLIYLLAIYCVYDEYTKCNNAESISHILKKCEGQVFILMLLMGFLTCLYEYYINLCNKKIMPFCCIIFLLIGIYGLLIYDVNYPIHYFFACISFISILFFMTYWFNNNNNNNKKKTFIKSSCIIQYLLSLLLILLMLLNKNILYIEGLILLNFAIFYIINNY
jgi:hypothetical protein